MPPAFDWGPDQRTKFTQSDQAVVGVNGSKENSNFSSLLNSYFSPNPSLNLLIAEGNAGQGARRGLVLTPNNASKHWQAVDEYLKTSPERDEEDVREGASEHRFINSWDFVTGGGSDGGFGFAGSTGATRGVANLKPLAGLTEGFQRLRG
jgi:hypothetical protein